MRPRGRPPLPRGIYPIEDPAIACPDAVVLDTSFVVEALLASQRLHGVCQDYLLRLAGAGTEFVFSRLLELELEEAVFQIALKERHASGWRRFRRVAAYVHARRG